MSMPITDPTQRFSSRVDNYVRYRPGYPPQILETLKNECGLKCASIIADVGSGTGLLSKLFLENGNRVFGIEPNQEMRQAGERLLQQYPNFSSTHARAEATTLPDYSVDFVSVGQAAHWFQADQARREFVRILKPGGWVALIWNDRVIDSTPLSAAFESLLLTYGTDYHEVRHIGKNRGLEIGAFFAPAPFRARAFENNQVLDYLSLEGRLLSASYTPQQGHPNYTTMLQELRRIFDTYQHDGRVVFEYKTNMYYGQLD